MYIIPSYITSCKVVVNRSPQHKNNSNQFENEIYFSKKMKITYQKRKMFIFFNAYTLYLEGHYQQKQVFSFSNL